ncbi:MAG: hypothetical protein WKF74_11280 [Pyrinomonadaceae bacterium]
MTISLPENTSDEESNIIKDRLFAVLNSMGANKGANGGLRWAGSMNCKPKYKTEDGSFPRVKLLFSSMNRIVTVDELEALGLLGVIKPTENSVEVLRGVSRVNEKPKQAPSYEKALASVRRKDDGEPDRSAADLHYSVTCLDWGFNERETIDLLKSKSEKARERRDKYAENTVRVALQKHRLNPSQKPVQQTKIIFGSRKNLLTEDEYAWRERAAIMEYDGGLSRTEAERLARLESTGQGLLDAA